MFCIIRAPSQTQSQRIVIHLVRNADKGGGVLMSIILPNLNHSFISPVPVPVPDSGSGSRFPGLPYAHFNVNSQSIRVALWSLLDSWINRNWEVRLIKSFRAPFRSSRSRPMFWSCKFTNSVQPQQHETELNISNNLYYRINNKNRTANLLRLSLPFHYWQSHLPYGSAYGLLSIQFACLVLQPRLKLVNIDLWIMF